MPMSSIAQAFPKLDSPEEWNGVDLSLIEDIIKDREAWLQNVSE